jgi:hypothetical protein
MRRKDWKSIYGSNILLWLYTAIITGQLVLEVLFPRETARA